ARDHAGLVQSGDGAARRSLCDQPQLQEGLRVADRVCEQRLSVVPGRRTRLRQLYGTACAELIAGVGCSDKQEPRKRQLPGFFMCAEYERQLGGGSPLSSLMTAKG